MRITVHRDKLSRAAAFIARVARRNFKQHLQMAMLEVKGDDLIISGTENDISATAVIHGPPDEGETNADGSIGVEAGRFAEIIAGMPRGPIGLERTLQGGKWSDLKITAGRVSLKLIPQLDASEWPKKVVCAAPMHQGISGGALGDMLAGTAYACGDSEERPFLRYILLRQESSGRFTAVATNGHRMAYWDGVITGMSYLPAALSVLIPMDAAKLIQNLIEEERSIGVALDVQTIAVTASGITLSARLGADSYPDITGLLAERRPIATALASRADLQAMLDRVGAIDAEHATVTTVTVAQGEIGMLQEDRGFSEGRDALGAEVTGEGEVIISPRYFADALRAIPEERVVLEIAGAHEPVLIRDEPGYRKALIMPIEVKEPKAKTEQAA